MRLNLSIMLQTSTSTSSTSCSTPPSVHILLHLLLNTSCSPPSPPPPPLYIVYCSIPVNRCACVTPLPTASITPQIVLCTVTSSQQIGVHLCISLLFSDMVISDFLSSYKIKGRYWRHTPWPSPLLSPTPTTFLCFVMHCRAVLCFVMFMSFHVVLACMCMNVSFGFVMYVPIWMFR